MRKTRISATMRIAIGLAFICATVLLAALAVGIIPSVREGVITARKDLCEAIAIAITVHANDYEYDRIKAVMGNIVDRNDEMLSAAIRRKSGETIAELGDHRDHWQADQANGQSFEHIVVPIIGGNQERWGSVETRFRPVEHGAAGIAGLLDRLQVRLFMFVPTACLVLFFMYLGKMLRHLDPSKVVPGRVRSAMDNLAGGLLIINQDQRVALANQAFAGHMNTTPENLVGTSIDALPWEPVGERMETPWTDAFETSSSQIGVTTNLRCDDEQKTFVTNCTPILGNDSQIRGVLTSFEDVTELEKKKIELKDSKDEAECANIAKSEFLARMSHEIRTPMNAILGFTDVLRGFDASEADREEYLNTIHSSGQYLLSIINDILDLSKVESGCLEVEHATCSPHQIIHDVIQVLNVKAEEKGIAITYEPTDNVPETIISDIVRVRQIITNLVDNAIKFTSRGGVRVISRFHSTSDGPMLAIEFVDSGIGMSPTVLEKVFEPFAQADTSTTRKFGGTGLGLSISRRFAEALGKGITVTSKEGKGSVFTVLLETGPTEGVKMLTADEALQIGSNRPKRETTEFHLPPSNILIVDDGIANRNLLRLLLTRAGATVELAENGKVGVEMVQQGQFDVVLMDMQMPVMDGYTATTSLRQQGYTLPVIALTGNAMQGDADKCFAAGCTGFLPKPVDSSQLIEMLTKVLGDSTSQGVSGACQDIAEAGADAGAVQTLSEIESVLGEFKATETSHREPASGGAVVANLPDRIPSSLPVEDEEIREIVEEFLGRLRPKVDEMRHAGNEHDFETLVEMGHWLKGAVPTVGFEAFAEPAKALEREAAACDLEKTQKSLEDIEEITARVCVSTDSSICAGLANS